jgi:hypothetical protein
MHACTVGCTCNSSTSRCHSNESEQWVGQQTFSPSTANTNIGLNSILLTLHRSLAKGDMKGARSGPSTTTTTLRILAAQLSTPHFAKLSSSDFSHRHSIPPVVSLRADWNALASGNNEATAVKKSPARKADMPESDGVELWTEAVTCETRAANLQTFQ